MLYGYRNQSTHFWPEILLGNLAVNETLNLNFAIIEFSLMLFCKQMTWDNYWAGLWSHIAIVTSQRIFVTTLCNDLSVYKKVIVVWVPALRQSLWEIVPNITFEAKMKPQKLRYVKCWKVPLQRGWPRRYGKRVAHERRELHDIAFLSNWRLLKLAQMFCLKDGGYSFSGTVSGCMTSWK